MNASALRILFNAGRRLQVETVDAGGAGGGGQRPQGPQRPQCPLPGLDLTLAEWQSDSFPFRDFDRFAETLAADAPGGAFEIRLSGEARQLAAAARQVVTRCQRLAARRNAASACDLFERALAGHRRLHDRTRPPAAPVYAHALDTWQWLLRLDPEAGLAPQLAALFHDLDRLGAEAGTPGGAGAWVADELLAELDVDLAVRVRVHRLITGRRPASDAADRFAAEIALLDDADVLSFFSLESAGYLDDFGAEQAARQVAHALARLRPASHTLLRGLRLRATVASLLERELAHRTVPSPVGAGVAVAAGPVRGGRPSRPSRGIAIARSRMAAGMAGGAGMAPTRTGALLARAAALGALAAPPVRPRAAAPGTRPLPGAVAAPTAGGALQRDLAKA